MNWIVDMFFWTDMALCFNTAYWNDEGKTWVTNRWRIAVNYLKFWFWLDFVSLFPCERASPASLPFEARRRRGPPGTRRARERPRRWGTSRALDRGTLTSRFVDLPLPSTMGVLRLVRLVRLVKLVRVAKAPRILAKWREIATMSFKTRMIFKYFGVLCSMVHLQACMIRLAHDHGAAKGCELLTF